MTPAIASCPRRERGGCAAVAPFTAPLAVADVGGSDSSSSPLLSATSSSGDVLRRKTFDRGRHASDHKADVSGSLNHWAGVVCHIGAPVSARHGCTAKARPLRMATPGLAAALWQGARALRRRRRHCRVPEWHNDCARRKLVAFWGAGLLRCIRLCRQRAHMRPAQHRNKSLMRTAAALKAPRRKEYGCRGGIFGNMCGAKRSRVMCIRPNKGSLNLTACLSRYMRGI